MWIELEKIHNEIPIISLPSKLAAELEEMVEVKFGGRTITAKVESFTQEELQLDRPIRVKFSKKLIEDLLIPIQMKYRLKIKNKQIIIGPVIGFLLGVHNYLYTPKRMTKYSDRFGIYDQVGGLVCGFSPKCIDWQQKIIYGLYYDIVIQKWVYGCFPMPDVIYRRNFHYNGFEISNLLKETNGNLFNSFRFDKYELFQHIMPNKELAQHLPHTELFNNIEQLNRFIKLYGMIILKPKSLSRGQGICIIGKVDNGYEIKDYRQENVVEIFLNDTSELNTFFDKNPDFFKNYLIQQFIHLVKVDNSVFDIRVVMQKGNNFNWQCTGVECRVAGNKSLLTNISRNGYAITLQQALTSAFSKETNIQKLIQEIMIFSEKLCVNIETMDKHYAEFGLDIGIDQTEKLWFIEANVFPSFKGFKKMDYQTYLQIRYQPLLYALFLTGLNE